MSFYDWMLNKLGWNEPPRTQHDELFPGATKPTTVLVNLIAADLISKGVSYPPRDKSSNEVLVIETLYGKGAQSVFGSDYLTDTLTGRNYKITTGKQQSGRVYVNEIKFRLVVDGVIFSEDEQEFIRNALRRAITIEENKMQAIREGKAQQRALDAVEEFMGIGKFAKVEPDEDPAKRPHDDNGCTFSCCNPKTKLETV